MLLSEHLLLESLREEKEPIFDRPELIDVAKNIFVNGKVTCHALDLTRHDMEISKASHDFAIGKLFPKEYKIFEAKYNEYVKSFKYAEKIGDRETSRKIRTALQEFTSKGTILTVKPRTKSVTRLYPYCLQTNGNIACIYVTKDKTDRIFVIIDPANNAIVTAHQCRPADLDARIVNFASLELLNLKVYGTLDVEPVDTYAALKNYEAALLTNVIKDKMMNKFFISQGIAPQVKQQAIRKFEEELRNRQV